MQDVIASDSKICLLDGVKGRLVYRGYDVADLVEHCGFEEVAHLLWTGALPTAAELDELKRKLAAHRPLSGAMHHLLGDLPASAPPMSLLRTCVSAMGLTDPRAESSDPAVNLEMAQEMTAQIASIVASIHRLRRGHGPVQPEPGLSHAANFLYMLSGKRPDERAARIFDGCLILHAEHEFNASTFAARVIAATLSDIYSAITGAIGALRGPLHGGANQKVMLMLQEIGQPSKAADHVRRLLAAKQKVMGFGHRVYKTEDPRATFLRRWSQELGEKLGQPQWFEISQVVEKRDAGGEENPLQRGFLLRERLSPAGDSDGPFYAGLRRVAHRRLDGARAGAVRGQPADPAAGEVRRAGGPEGASRSRSGET